MATTVESPAAPAEGGPTETAVPGFRIPIRIRDAGRTLDQTSTDYILEIDKNRIFVRTKEVRPVGTEVHLEFNLKGAPRPVVLRGEVVRVSDGTDPKEAVLGQGMGITFLNISFDNAKLINDYLNFISSGEKGEDYETFIHWVEHVDHPLALARRQQRPRDLEGILHRQRVRHRPA